MILNNAVLLQGKKLVKKDLYIKDGVIKAVRNNLDKGIDCKGKFLMPGLRNAHVHLGSRSVSGAAIGLNKYEYFDNIGFKSHDKRTKKDVYKASLLACLESLQEGVTHIDTMDTTIKPVIKALEESGLEYSACLAVKDAHLEAGDINEQFKKILDLKDNPNVIMGLANEYECSPQLLREGLEFAREYDLPIHMHAAETRKEVAHMKRLTGKRTIEYLHDIGLLDHNTRIAHCTYADSKEVLLLSNSVTPVLHCPTSNQAISNNQAPINHFIRNQVPLMIGTDSFAWNPDASVLKEAWRSHALTGISVLQAYKMTHEKLIQGSNANFSLINMDDLKPYHSTEQFITRLMLTKSEKKVYIKGKKVKIKKITKLRKEVNKISKRLLNQH